jgi:uncharacterized protein (DUF305 family)
VPGSRELIGVAVLVAVVLAGGVAGVLAADDRPSRPPADGVDVGFLRDMIDHHEQAVLLSLLALRNGASPPIRDAAVDVIASQREEIGTMEGWLTMWGHERGQPTRRAMTWMGMDSAVQDMPGMAGRPQLEALTAATGQELDALFLSLMIDHHEGGIHMGEHAARTASDGHVRFLATQIARNQQREIRHLRAMQEGLAAAEG